MIVTSKCSQREALNSFKEKVEGPRFAIRKREMVKGKVDGRNETPIYEIARKGKKLKVGISGSFGDSVVPCDVFLETVL